MYSKLLRQIREQTKFQGGLNPDYTTSVVQADQFQGLYREHDLHGRFDFVFSVQSTGKSFGPEQNLTTTYNSMSSVDVKRRFEAMVIKGCCDVTVHHNVFKFS